MKPRTCGALAALIFVCAAGCRPPAAAPAPEPDAAARAAAPAWFQDVSGTAGISWRQGHHGRTPLPVLEMMGTGCAVRDFDGDGIPDLFFVGQKGTGNTGRCALYRGAIGPAYRDVTAGSGLAVPGMFMGCGAADLDNDGLPDIVLTGYGTNRLFRNLGGMRFKDVTTGSGLESTGPSDWRSAVAIADVDRDGLLDLYLGRYVVFHKDVPQLCDYGKLQSSCGPKFYDPQFGTLHRNQGSLRFTDMTRSWGLPNQHGKCLGATFCDIDRDGWPDLYLGNDEVPGDLFVNEKGRRFRNEGLLAGVSLAGDGQMQGAMGVDFGDFNRDGEFDLFITTFEFEPASLYSGQGGRLFRNVSTEVGLEHPTRSLVGFGTKFADFDNDGWADLAIANGHIHDNQNQIDSNSHYPQPLQLFMNRRGEAFEDRSGEAGPGFSTPCVGRGLATGDLDRDGRVDLLVTDLEGAPRVLLNRMGGTGSWLRVRLQGRKSNRDAVGARVEVRAAGADWTAEVTTGGSYFSAMEPILHFGLGSATSVDSVEVWWPSGRTGKVAGPRVNSEILLEEPR